MATPVALFSTVEDASSGAATLSVVNVYVSSSAIGIPRADVTLTGTVSVYGVSISSAG